MRKKQEERFSVVAFEYSSGTRAWRVQGYGIDGKQVRKNLLTREEAVAFKWQLENMARNGQASMALRQTRLTDKQLTEAEWAFECLRNQSISLREAVNQFLKELSS